MRRAPLAFTLTTLALAACWTAARAECSATSSLIVAGSSPVTLVAATADTSFFGSGFSCGSYHAGYHMETGVLVASLSQGMQCGSSIETIVEDDFTVLGVPAGTPVNFDAVLDLDGSAQDQGEPGGGGGGRVRGLLQAGAAVVSDQQATGPTPAITVHESLTLPLATLAGTPVRLHVAVRAEAGDGTSSLQGTFRFASLPEGARVVSCRGYASDSPVPARTSSWGRLKAAYR